MIEEKQQLRNPIDGKIVDEIIKEKEARQRGYFELEFLLKYLEDDNEFVKYFIVNDKKIVVDLEKPYLQYKKKTQVNHERILQEKEKKVQVDQSTIVPVDACCDLVDGTCISCGS